MPRLIILASGKDWGAKHRQDNPYLLLHSTVSEREIHLQLAQEEALASEKGVLPLHYISPVEFVIAGLELKEVQ